MSGRNFDEDVDRIERAIAAGHTAMTERDALRAEVERLRDADVVPDSLAQRFKDERNIARLRVEELEQALGKIEQWATYGYQDLNSGGVLSCVRKVAHAALHPDQQETT